MIQEIDWEQKKAEAKARQALLNSEVLSPQEQKQAHKTIQRGFIEESLGGVKRMVGGLYSGASRTSKAMDNVTKWMAKQGSKILDVPEEKLRGGMFDLLAQDWDRYADKYQKEGIQGFAGEVFTGLGQAGWDISTIIALGQWGLPIHGGLMGMAEGGTVEAAKGATVGALTHGALKGIGGLPSKARLPAFAGMGAAISPGGVEEKAKGAAIWTALGIAGSGPKKTLKEFKETYKQTKIPTIEEGHGVPARGSAYMRMPIEMLKVEAEKGVRLAREALKFREDKMAAEPESPVLPMESPKSVSIPAPKDQPVLSPQEIADVVTAVKQLKPYGRKQKRMYGKEFGQRIAKGEAVARKVGGEAGFYAKKAQLEGEYEKVELSPDFEALREALSPETIDKLNNTIEYNPFLWKGEKVQAGEGLQSILEGKLPQPKQLELLQTALGESGPEFVSALMKKRAWLKRAVTKGFEIGNAPRSLMAGFMDLSFGLRQGAFAAPRFYREFGRSWKKQFKEFGSEKAYQAAMDTVKYDPYYLLAREGDVAFTEMGKLMGKREEPYMSPLPEQIPVLGKGIRMTGRSYTGFANKFRMDIFKRMAKDAENMGHKLEGNRELLRVMGGTVNAMTGRGGLGKLGAIAPALNATFFSPRLWSSRLGLMFGKYNPLNPAHYIMLPKNMRMEVLKTWMAYASAGITITTAAKMMGADVETDMRSPDFLKMRIGNTRIDIWSGLQQPVRTMAQFISGQTKSSVTGKIRDVREKGYKPLTRGEILGRHIEYKEAPLASFVHNWMQGQSGLESFSLKKEASEKLLPIVAQDIWDLYQDDPDSLPLGLLAIFGVGIQTYERRKKMIR